MLVRTLALPGTVEEYEPGAPIHVWPSAYSENATAADWAALEPLYPAEDLELFRDFGGFIGWRAGIARNGDWRFYVAGD